MRQRTTATNPAAAMRSLRERQREERAALILSVAQDVFAEKGYYDASIDEIAERAGIAKGTVYLHFASKEDLVVALVEQQIIGFLALVDQAISETTTVRARLERLLLHSYTSIHAQRSQVVLELNNSIGLTRRVIEQRTELRAHIARATDRIAELFEEGKRTGELDPAVPTPVMVATFVSLISPHGYEQLLTSGQSSPEEFVRHISRMFFHGVLAPSSERSSVSS